MRSLLLFFFVTPFLSAQIVINEVSYSGPTDKIELKNIGGSTVDISSWSFCSLFSYGQLSSLTVESGSLTLASGALVVLSGFSLHNTSADLGLYNTNIFGSTSAMEDFVEWGTHSQGREGVAELKAIWPTNDFVPTVASGHSIEWKATGDGSSHWYDQATSTLGAENTLPVELSSFIATVQDLNITLLWRTETEVNNSEFQVERKFLRKKDGENHYWKITHPAWEPIGRREGAGTTNTPHDYSFNDHLTTAGIYQYRLKQIDRDGAFQYSSVQQVEVVVPFSLNLYQNYPNPFNPSTTITFTVPANGHVVLKIFNTLGQEITTLYNKDTEAGEMHTVQFSGEELPSGMYYARLEFNGNKQLKKMLMIK